MSHQCLRVLAMLAVIAASSLAETETKIAQREKTLGTGSKTLASFHRVVEEHRGLALRFPGLIIGIEKSERKNIGLTEDRVFPLGTEKEWVSEEAFKEAKGILNDGKRSFLSHIVEYRVDDKGGCGYVAQEMLYNTYHPKEVKSFENEFQASLDIAMAKLKGSVKKRFDGDRKPTHILVYAMGWNTPQKEAFDNFNSLIIQLIRRAPKGKPFRPLFLGITWHSQWAIPLVSIGNKGNDADEIGMTWASLIVRDVLVPLNRDPRVPLILVGHSLGARIAIGAAIGMPRQAKLKSDDIDLVFAIEPAFSVRRFVAGKGSEGSPYQKFSAAARKFVVTWSEKDSANPSAIWSAYAGGKSGYQYSTKHGLFSHLKTQCVSSPTEIHVRLNGIVPTDGTTGSLRKAIQDRDTVTFIDASDLIRFELYGHGGGAHSDIYTPGLADLWWRCVGAVSGQ